MSSNMDDRIVIIGNAGGGKSTFARKLGKALFIPVFHIDNLQWGESWQRKVFKKAHAELMTLKSWIIDGLVKKLRFIYACRKQM